MATVEAIDDPHPLFSEAVFVTEGSSAEIPAVDASAVETTVLEAVVVSEVTVVVAVVVA